MSDVFQLVPALLSGTAAFAGAWLAPMRFRSERWFDKKAAFYSSVFDALNDMAEEWEHYWNESVKDNYGLTPEFRTALVEASAKARLEIRNAVRIGSFIISEESEEILALFITRTETARVADDWTEYVDNNWALVSETIAKLRDSARHDLGLGRWKIRAAAWTALRDKTR